MTEYHTIKKLITKISTLDHSHHYDIFNILCRYNMTYSKNSNGFFFDFLLLIISHFYRVANKRF